MLMLNACTTLGPDFEEPEVAWLNDWQPDLYGQIGNAEQQTEVDLRFWWRLFNDPVLNGLIGTARRESPSLRIAGLRILESRAVLGIAGSNLYPQLQQLGGAVTYVSKRPLSGQAVDQDQSLTSYQATFDFGWELDFWGRFRRSIESADAAFFASISRQQDVQVLLSAQVADLYFAYRTTSLRIGIARRYAAIQKRSFEITEKIYQSGLGSELDLQQAKTQYLATLSTIPDLEATLIRLRNALGALLGRAPGQVPELMSVEGQLPEMEPVVIEGIPARLLLRRPDIRTAARPSDCWVASVGLRIRWVPALVSPPARH
jgi:outer membrane protein TolC